MKKTFRPPPQRGRRTSASGMASLKIRKQSIRALVRQNAAQRRKEMEVRKRQRQRFLESGQYKFKDVSAELAAVPGTLEIHPTKNAPSLKDVEDEFIKERDKELNRFFTVPIKVYETTDEEFGTVDPSAQEFTEEDRLQLHRYGSRVVINKAGHVVALEVRNDVMKRFKLKSYTADICQCQEMDYEISDSLRKDSNTRRTFMFRVLLLETLFKIPSFGWLMVQIFITPVHHFFYEHILLVFLFATIFMIIRVVVVYSFPEQIYGGKVKRALLVGVTCIGYCLTYGVGTSFFLRHFVYYLEYNQYEDPTSLFALTEKLQRSNFSHPYIFALAIFYHVLQNMILIGFLSLPQKVFDEMQNGFLLIIFLSHVIFLVVTNYVVHESKLFPEANLWDRMQIFFSALFMGQWVMWRIYVLQEVVRGKKYSIYEDQYLIEALRLAF